jgi:hypothetical protein
MTDTIDETSRQFIDWAFTNMEDEQFYQDLLKDAYQQFEDHYKQPKGQVLSDLKAKMIRGAQEHGAPILSVEKVDTELNGEYLDLVGWMLIKKWNQIRLASENAL